MIRYELKKLCRRPIFLFIMLAVLAFKATYAFSDLNDIRPDKAYVALVDEYSEYSLDEAARRIQAENEAAKASYFRDYESDYARGELTIDEFRAYQLAFPQRAAYYNATQKVASQVARLQTLKDNMEWSDTPSSEIKVIDETGWILADRLKGVWLCPFILAFLAVAILCEWHDDGMYDLLRTTSGGIRRSIKAKLTIYAAVATIVALLDSASIYLIPKWLYGLDGAKTAVQSATIYSDVSRDITLEAHSVILIMRDVAKSLTVGVLWAAVSLLGKKSYRTIGIILLVSLLAILLYT